MDTYHKIKFIIGLICIISLIVFMVILHSNITFCKINCEPDEPMGFLTLFWVGIFCLIYRRCTY
jgi:hypothetical protein